MNESVYVPVAVPPPGGMGRVHLWFRATRPVYVLTSVVPGLAGGLVALRSPHPRWWLLPVALVALGLVHAATNASNDVEDGARGLDAPDKIENSGVFNNGLLSTGEGRRLYAALFGVAFLMGVGICLVQGPALLVIGALGILGGLLYTAGPKPYKYLGLGDPAIICLMGPLITQGTYTAVTGTAFHAAAFWIGLGPGLLIASVLAANNLCDIDGDRAAGVQTLPVRLGFVRGRTLYVGELMAGTLVPVVFWATGLLDAWILLPLAVAPLAVGRCRQVLAARDSTDGSLEGLTALTAQVHLLACVLLCVAVTLERLL
jgi:1,4-dihydroxy-2-naphthoate octaprenyltransferase